MPTINQRTITGFITNGTSSSNTSVVGKALEDLVCYLFDLVPGVAITERNAVNTFASEEIDVALWNDSHADGLPFLPNLILIECKNWSKAVGSSEVNWFDTKLRNRGLDFGILLAANGITGDPQDLTAAHKIVADALKEKRKLVVITTAEVQGLASTADLAILIKTKLCKLMVSCSIV